MQNGVMGIGFSLPHEDDFTFAHLEASLDWAAVFQPDFVELPLFSFDVIAAGRIMPERLKRLKALTAGRDFRFTAHGPFAVNFMEDAVHLPMIRTVLRAFLEVAAELGVVHFVVHSGIFDASNEHKAEELYAQQREALAEAAEVAAALGVIIAVENLYPGSPARRTTLPSRLAEEIAAIGHPNLRGCLDFSHAFVQASHMGADPMVETAAFAPYAKHLHVHDSFGRISYRHIWHRAERLAFADGDLHLPLGMGTLPWDALVEKLTFPEGVVLNLEVDRSYKSELPASIAKARELAARMRTASNAAA